MVAPILIPILTTLATKGLDLIGSAILAKGKDVVEKELGVNIEDALVSEEGTEKLRIAQMEHEEKLIELALEDKKLDASYYQIDAQDRASAREREVRVIEAEHAGWLNTHIASILALTITVGGGFFLYFSTESDIKYAVVALMSSVLTYYFGSSKTSAQKDIAINNLSVRKE